MARIASSTPLALPAASAFELAAAKMVAAARRLSRFAAA
jgi:hypothetical protein